MKEVIRYQCEFCKKDFKTPNRHYCKMNPKLKNCFTCKFLKGWTNDSSDYDIGTPAPYPECMADEDPSWNDWNLETIKEVNYDMQCEKWEQGKYDWRKDFKEYEGMEALW